MTGRPSHSVTGRRAVDWDQMTFLLPENENEEDEQGEKDGHVVHGAQHDHQLASQVGHETDQFEDAQEAEGSQDR